MSVTTTIQSSTGFLFAITVSNLISYFIFTTWHTKLTFMCLMGTHTILFKHVPVACLCAQLQIKKNALKLANLNCILINKLL